MTTTISGTSITTPAANIGTTRQIAQIVTLQTGAVATGTTPIPWDDTIPQNTEGDQYMSLSITPTDAGSTLEIDATIYGACTEVGAAHLTAALFVDSDANALAAAGETYGAASYLTSMRIRHTMVAGSTTTKTFKVRMGGGGAGTTTFNGKAGARVYGGVISSGITIKEYLP